MRVCVCVILVFICCCVGVSVVCGCADVLLCCVILLLCVYLYVRACVPIRDNTHLTYRTLSFRF